MDFMEALLRAAKEPINQQTLDQFNEAAQGIDGLLGLRYTHVSNGLVRSELPVKPHLFQPAGMVNGGVFASMAESAGSIASMVAAGAPVVGVNNSTDFIGAVRSGTIQAEATPIQIGRRTHLWQIEMTREGKLVARTVLRTMPVSMPG